MPRPRLTPALAMASKPHEESDLRRLLDLADSIQSSYELSARRLTTFRLIFLLAFVTAVTIAVGAWLAGGFDTRLTGTAVAAILAIATVCAQFLLYPQLQARLYRDRRALDEVVPLLRELEAIAAQEESWSPVERAEYRIRLSRFDIE